MTNKQVNSRKNIIGAIFLLSLAFAICYFGSIKGLVNIWYTDEDYSYGFLIPIVSAYLIWERRKQPAELTPYPNWLGLVPFFIFLMISIYGILGSSPSAVRPMVPLILLPITLLCFGTSVFRVLFFPLFFLIFMIPLPTAFGTTIGVPLKLLSTKIGEILLQIFGVSVFVHGNVIDLGVTQLQVVDACSGLRYILPLLALGFLFAYVFEQKRWKQVLLVFMTIPIAVVTNGIRIGATGLLSQKYGSKVAMGFFHGFSGWLVFLFAFFLLFILWLALRVLFQSSGGSIHANHTDREDTQVSTIGPTANRHFWLPVVICSASLLIVGAIGLSTSSLPKLSLRGGLSGFPLAINEWAGQQATIDPEIITLSGAEDAVSVNYRDKQGAPASLYIGYRGSPFMESGSFFHSPNVCLPSLGWTTLESSKYIIDKVPQFGTLAVRRMVIEQMGQKELVYYWFQTKSKASYDVNINRFHLAMHAIRRDNTHDLFIRLMTPIKEGEQIEAAQQRLDGFAREMMVTLLEFLKEKQVTQ